MCMPLDNSGGVCVTLKNVCNIIGVCVWVVWTVVGIRDNYLPKFVRGWGKS